MNLNLSALQQFKRVKTNELCAAVLDQDWNACKMLGAVIRDIDLQIDACIAELRRNPVPLPAFLRRQAD